MKSEFLLILLLCPTIFLDLVLAHVRKFSQADFNKWLDNDSYVIALFCSSVTDQDCISERHKMKLLSEEMVQYSDIVFGYIDKETDALLVSKYDIQKFPVIKFFPYNKPSQNFYLNIPISNFKDKVLEIRKEHLTTAKDEKAIKKSSSKNKKSQITEIESTDFESKVKDPEKHVMLILYEIDSNEACQILEKVAKIFEEENEVAFYKLRLDKTEHLRQTFSFSKDPTIYWYPKSEKKGFTYGGKVTFKILVEYINDRAGLSRNYNGDLKADAGRIAEIDQIIQANILDIIQKTNINSVIIQIQRKGKEIPHHKKYIDYYLEILKEIRKGSDPGQTLNREQEFLNKKVSKEGLNRKETDEWRKYYNIITAFVDFAAKKHQEEHVKKIQSKKGKTQQPNPDVQKRAELKEDPHWKHQSHHDEL